MAGIDISKYTPQFIEEARKANPGLADELEKLVAQVKAKSNPAVNGIKVTEKGGISVYGLGRFPVTLYREQWQALFAMRDEVSAFMERPEVKAKCDAAFNSHELAKATKKAVKSQ